MHEYVGNLHMHTTASDGHGTHDQVADAAIRAGLDFVVITDHNTLPMSMEGYHYLGFHRILRLIGEEVHDVDRVPEKSHLLVYGVDDELSTYAERPQRLIREAEKRGGLTFLAHPVDCGVVTYDQPDLSWDDWQVEGYTGLEIWNFMTSFKCLMRSRAHAIYYGLFPSRISQGPEREILERWDRLTATGQRTVAIGGADAHAMPVRFGPIRRTVFPYQWLFRAVNTHVLLEQSLSGDAPQDRQRILDAIGRGRCFVGYDLPAPTRGFMFSAHSEFGRAIMGDRVRFRLGATLQVSTPFAAEIRILRHGQVVRRWPSTQHAALTIGEAGAYRVEAALRRAGGPPIPWIYSNPIYVEQG